MASFVPAKSQPPYNFEVVIQRRERDGGSTSASPPRCSPVCEGMKQLAIGGVGEEGGREWSSEYSEGWRKSNSNIREDNRKEKAVKIEIINDEKKGEISSKLDEEDIKWRNVKKKKKKKKIELNICVGLTKEEIEEDIFALTGSKASRRPKRRPKNIQKLLNLAFPGLWLVSITPESYKV
ncbi:hypothetical protein C2S51_001369 [Perilla frutescens var. frutescens]|nr:hypothetical protein C2S51_001369 [Perilla frutescens var. frutescens]